MRTDKFHQVDETTMETNNIGNNPNISVQDNSIELTSYQRSSIKISDLNPELAKKLRKFDVTNDGTIGLNEALQALVTLQKQSNNYKKMLYLIIPLCILILASVFGITLLALKMMKDTSVTNGHLMDMNGNVLKTSSADLSIKNSALISNDGEILNVKNLGGKTDIGMSFVTMEEPSIIPEIEISFKNTIKTFQDANPTTLNIGSNFTFEIQNLEKVGFLQGNISQIFNVNGIALDVGTKTVDWNSNLLKYMTYDPYCLPLYNNAISIYECKNAMWSKCQQLYPSFFAPGLYANTTCSSKTLVTQNQTININYSGSKCWLIKTKVTNKILMSRMLSLNSPPSFSKVTYKSIPLMNNFAPITSNVQICSQTNPTTFCIQSSQIINGQVLNKYFIPSCSSGSTTNCWTSNWIDSNGVQVNGNSPSNSADFSSIKSNVLGYCSSPSLNSVSYSNCACTDMSTNTYYCTYDVDTYAYDTSCLKNENCPTSLNINSDIYNVVKCDFVSTSSQTSVTYNTYDSSQLWTNFVLLQYYQIWKDTNCITINQNKPACSSIYLSDQTRQRLSIDFGNWYIFQSNIARDYNFDWKTLSIIPPACGNNNCTLSCSITKWCAYSRSWSSNDPDTSAMIQYANSFLNNLVDDYDMAYKTVAKTTKILISKPLLIGYTSPTSYKSTTQTNVGTSTSSVL